MLFSFEIQFSFKSTSGISLNIFLIRIRDIISYCFATEVVKDLGK